MFFVPSLGLVTSHTKEQYDRLERGEGVCYITYRTCLAVVDWVYLDDKPLALFPERPITREQYAMILNWYGGQDA